jgi:hypothetical protein
VAPTPIAGSLVLRRKVLDQGKELQTHCDQDCADDCVVSAEALYDGLAGGLLELEQQHQEVVDPETYDLDSYDLEPRCGFPHSEEDSAHDIC